MKKGFTLIELISVIVIIGVLSLITVPIVTGVIADSKQKAYERTVKTIEEAAYNFSIYNNLGYSDVYKKLELSRLQEKGYLQAGSVVDPRTSEEMNGCILYKWLTDKNQYEFTYSEDCDSESLNPKVVINVLNEIDKSWMNERLKIEISGKYNNYKYCVGNSNCEPNLDYTDIVTIQQTGSNIYVCAKGYTEEEETVICTKSYNIDIEKPQLVVSSVSTTSNKIIVDATCSDKVSDVKNIQYSVNNGVYQNNNVFTDLVSGEYDVKIKCTDNANNETIVEQKAITSSMSTPTIVQLSQTPDNSTYAQERVIRITYSGENVNGPKYYYSYDNKEWIEVTSTIYDVTFTKDGYLYAKIEDSTGNVTNSATYTVANIDEVEPTVSVTVSGKEATFILKDNIGVVGYGVNQLETIEPTYTDVLSATEITETWVGSAPGTYYVWVKDASGRISKAVFMLEESAFRYNAVLTSSTYNAYRWCYNGYTMSGEQCIKNNPTYSCPNGGDLNGTTCTTTSTYTATGQYPKCNYGTSVTCNSIVNGECRTGGTTTVTGTVNCDNLRGYPVQWCPSPTNGRHSACGDKKYTCPNGGTLNGTTCTTTETYAATETYETTQIYHSCDGGDTLNGTICTKQSYTCPNGGTLIGTVCQL